jgi:hypothetical protein
MLKTYTRVKSIHLSADNNKRILFFSNLPDVHQFDTSVVHDNIKTIVFNSCNQNFVNNCLNPKFFPNLKIIYMNSWCKDEIYKFNNITVYAPIKIYDNNIVCGYWNKSSTFIKIIDDDHFRVLEQLIDRNVINRE